MSINRHNYEEYFILYLDNELGNEDRRMVESFVQQHPDLKEELDILLQYKLVPDHTISFPGKEELLKENGHSLITENNYEEWLTLYTDNELPKAQRTLVENYVAADPTAQKDLALLLKTRLEPEVISFPDKASLYRTTENRRIPLFGRVGWRAAAAVLLFLLGTSVVLIMNKKQSPGKDDVATVKPAVTKEQRNNNTPGDVKENSITPVLPEQKNSIAVVQELTDNNDATITPVNKEDVKTVIANKNKTIVPVNVSQDKIIPVDKKETQVIADVNNKLSNNLPQPDQNPNAITLKTENAIASNKNDANNSIVKADDPVVTKNTGSPSPYIQAAATEELEQPDGKKNRNRGIFRKITRTFEKRTDIDPTDDNKLLVAGLSIKLK